MITNLRFLPTTIKVSEKLLLELGIKDFTYKELKATGAAPEDIRINTIIALQEWRKSIGVPVHIVYNGITTGQHQSIEHPDGKALDTFILPADKIVDKVFLKRCYYAAIDSGFRGIGTYYNVETNITGFHLDIGKNIRRWKAVKLKKSFNWHFLEFSFDQRSLK